MEKKGLQFLDSDELGTRSQPAHGVPRGDNGCAAPSQLPVMRQRLPANVVGVHARMHIARTYVNSMWNKRGAASSEKNAIPSTSP